MIGRALTQTWSRRNGSLQARQAFQASFGRISRHFTGALLPHFTGAKPATSTNFRFNKLCEKMYSHTQFAARFSSLLLSHSLSDSVLLTLSLLYAHTIMITIFPRCSRFCLCVCRVQQQQQITFINWFLATKCVCVSASQSCAAAFQAQGVRLKANGDRETAHFLRTFYVHIYIYKHICVSCGRLNCSTSLCLPFFPSTYLSLSFYFSHSQMAFLMRTLRKVGNTNAC